MFEEAHSANNMGTSATPELQGSIKRTQHQIPATEITYFAYSLGFYPADASDFCTAPLHTTQAAYNTSLKVVTSNVYI